MEGSGNFEIQENLSLSHRVLKSQALGALSFLGSRENVTNSRRVKIELRAVSSKESVVKRSLRNPELSLIYVL